MRIIKERANARGSIDLVEEEQKIVLTREAPLAARIFSALDRDAELYVVMNRWIIHPSSKFMTCWNVVMGVTIVLCAVSGL